jgi:uncharacterized protein with ATP-grasp and redox domains
MDCGHGWRNAAECDVCTLRRVNPQAADRIDVLEAALTTIRDTLPIVQDNYSRRVFAVAAEALEPESR